MQNPVVKCQFNTTHYDQNFLILSENYEAHFFHSILVIYYILNAKSRVSVQGVKSLGSHFACLCRGFDFYEVKIEKNIIIFQKEQSSINLLL